MEADQYMWSDLLLQGAIMLLILLMILSVNNLPQRLFSNLLLRLTGTLRPSHYQAKRHFVLGAQLLSQARSHSPSDNRRRPLAERAAAEADQAIALNPRDAASHILKALALDLQGFRASAIDSLDAALSPLAAGSLSDAERGDALLKRAELLLASASASASADGGVAEDVAESARLIGQTAKGCGLLGEWYEKKGMKEEARRAYQDAIRLRPDYGSALDGLARLDSPS